MDLKGVSYDNVVVVSQNRSKRPAAGVNPALHHRVGLVEHDMVLLLRVGLDSSILVAWKIKNVRVNVNYGGSVWNEIFTPAFWELYIFVKSEKVIYTGHALVWYLITTIFYPGILFFFRYSLNMNWYREPYLRLHTW